MSSPTSRPFEYSSDWEQIDAEAKALSTLFPDWPGCEDDMDNWLHAATPAPLPAQPFITAPTPEPTREAAYQPTPSLIKHDYAPTSAKPAAFGPKPPTTTKSPYLKPLLNKADNAAVWTHIQVQDLPFNVQAIVTLSAIPAHWAPRGFAHRQAWVGIQLLQGGFSMVVDDGEKTSTLGLYSTDHLLLLPPLIWRRFVNVLDDTLLLCLSSHSVAEPDNNGQEWITDYGTFLTLRT